MGTYISTSRDKNRLGNTYTTYGPISILKKSATPETKRTAIKYRKTTGKKRMPTSYLTKSSSLPAKARKSRTSLKVSTATGPVKPKRTAKLQAASSPTRSTYRAKSQSFRAQPSPSAVLRNRSTTKVKVRSSATPARKLKVSSAPRPTSRLRVR